MEERILYFDIINGISGDMTLSSLLDLGTGSGCIVLSILAQCKDMYATAVDISDKALTIAKKNAKNLGVYDRCRFVNAGWFDTDFNDKIEKTYDIIVSNPPYIPTSDIETLEPELGFSVGKCQQSFPLDTLLGC